MARHIDASRVKSRCVYQLIHGSLARFSPPVGQEHSGSPGLVAAIYHLAAAMAAHLKKCVSYTRGRITLAHAS